MSFAPEIADVCLVIPNWNGEQHLRECLDSVRKQTLQPRLTMLVDNGSTDGSLRLVAGEYPWVTVLALPSNTGFAVAVNKGIVASTNTYVALLNNDTQLEADWLATLVSVLRDHLEVGIAGSKTLKFYDRNVIDGAGDALTRGGAPYTRGMGEPDDGRYNRREYVFSACAGAALYRRTVFDRVGLFDEDFVSYYEDQDLAFRAQLMGFRCMFVPEALCYHKRGATGNLIPMFPLRMQERNLTSFYVKNFPWQVLLVKLPLIVGSRLRRLYRAFRTGAGKPMLQGFGEGFRLLPQTLAKRRRVQNSRTVSLRYVLSLMRGRNTP
jgi:GT2 family glycosyltransferase